MARMPGVPQEQTGWLVKALFAGVRRKAGSVSESFRIAGWNPRILLGWSLHDTNRLLLAYLGGGIIVLVGLLAPLERSVR